LIKLVKKMETDIYLRRKGQSKSERKKQTPERKIGRTRIVSMEEALMKNTDGTEAIGIEAREFFKKSGEDNFAVNYFDNKIAEEFVDSLYKAGVKLVVVTGLQIGTDVKGKPWIYADTILIEKPTKKAMDIIVSVHPDEYSGEDIKRLWWD
jgi:hypothetical protein